MPSVTVSGSGGNLSCKLNIDKQIVSNLVNPIASTGVSLEMSVDDFLHNPAERILASRIEFVPAREPYDFVAKQLKEKYIHLKPKQVALVRPFSVATKSICEVKGHSSSLYARQEDDGIPSPRINLYPMNAIKLHIIEKIPIGFGLKNLGNTCFLNSILQVLAYTTPLVNYLRGEKHRCPNSGYCSLCELRNHFQRVLKPNVGFSAIAPMNILQNTKIIMKTYISGRQEDAHEFLRYLIDSLQSACLFYHKPKSLDMYSKQTTPISRIFGGYHRNEITCFSCRTKSTTYDPFLDISLEIKQQNSINAALRHFTKPEVLQETNAYYCPKCKRKCNAEKRYTIHRPSVILTIQLKRFDHFGKINKPINFPEQLNIRPFMSVNNGPPQLYQLYGVVVHQGGSTNSGHYFAFVKNGSGCWHLMDDNRVCSVKKDNVLKANAYLLFYISAAKPVVKPEPIPSPQINTSSKIETAGSSMVAASTSSQSAVSETHVAPQPPYVASEPLAKPHPTPTTPKPISVLVQPLSSSSSVLPIHSTASASSVTGPSPVQRQRIILKPKCNTIPLLGSNSTCTGFVPRNITVTLKHSKLVKPLSDLENHCRVASDGLVPGISPSLSESSSPSTSLAPIQVAEVSTTCGSDSAANSRPTTPSKGAAGFKGIVPYSIDDSESSAEQQSGENTAVVPGCTINDPESVAGTVSASTAKHAAPSAESFASEGRALSVTAKTRQYLTGSPVSPKKGPQEQTHSVLTEGETVLHTAEESKCEKHSGLDEASAAIDGEGSPYLEERNSPSKTAETTKRKSHSSPRRKHRSGSSQSLQSPSRVSEHHHLASPDPKHAHDDHTGRKPRERKRRKRYSPSPVESKRWKTTYNQPELDDGMTSKHQSSTGSPPQPDPDHEPKRHSGGHSKPSRGSSSSGDSGSERSPSSPKRERRVSLHKRKGRVILKIEPEDPDLAERNELQAKLEKKARMLERRRRKKERKKEQKRLRLEAEREEHNQTRISSISPRKQERHSTYDERDYTDRDPTVESNVSGTGEPLKGHKRRHSSDGAGDHESSRVSVKKSVNLEQQNRLSPVKRKKQRYSKTLPDASSVSSDSESVSARSLDSRETSPKKRVNLTSPHQSSTQAIAWDKDIHRGRDLGYDRSKEEIPEDPEQRRPSSASMHTAGSSQRELMDFLKGSSISDGYGKSVSSWNGSVAHVDKSAAVESENGQHGADEYDQEYNDDYDRGRVKKKKRWHVSFPENAIHGNNPFQKAQDRHNASEASASEWLLKRDDVPNQNMIPKFTVIVKKWPNAAIKPTTTVETERHA